MRIEANRRIHISTTCTYRLQRCSTGPCFNLKYFIVLKNIWTVGKQRPEKREYHVEKSV